MAGENTVTTLNGLFQNVYGDKLKNLIPEGTKLLNKIPFGEREKSLGSFYVQSVILG